jgi:hypothetical protein
MSEITEYQKVAALLSMDIQTMSMAVARHPDMAAAMFAKLEENRLRIINDVDYRELRYGASMVVFNIPVESPDLEESGEL